MSFNVLLSAVSVPILSWQGALLRLVVAGALGGAVGFERELREREAGLRTHMLVSVGSALFTIVDQPDGRSLLIAVRYRSRRQSHEATERIAGLSGLRRLQWVP